MNARVWFGHVPGFSYEQEMLALESDFGVAVEDWDCSFASESARPKLAHARVPHEEVFVWMCEPWGEVLMRVGPQELVDRGATDGSELYRRSFLHACRVSRELSDGEPWLCVPGDFAGLASELSSHYGWRELERAL